MIKLFEFLWHGCWHTWKETERYRVTQDDGGVIGYALIQQCTKCGHAKRINLY